MKNLKIALLVGLLTFMANDGYGQIKRKWITLFDGETMRGWRGYNRVDIPEAWSIEDHTLKINKKTKIKGAYSERGDIIFTTPFKDFELRLQYKVDSGSNSGVLYLVTEKPGRRIYEAAPEFQVLDNDNHPDAKKGKEGNRKAGSLYDMIAANPQVGKPYGEWNKVRIIVKDGHVKHYLNGKKVVEYILWNDEWKSRVADSKFKAWHDFLTPGGEAKAGFIALQDHNDNVWFRNIKVRIL